MKTRYIPALALAVAGLASFSAQGAALLSSTDFIQGVHVTNPTISVGTSGFGFNQWPINETPALAIDGDTSTKYLNFGENNSGLLVTPGVGASFVDSISITSANDFPDRDPASFILMGTNNDGSLDLNDYDAIASGAVPAFAGRFTEQTIRINATESYTSDLLYFPTVLNSAAANSMQISEVSFDGTVAPAGIPEPSSTLLLGLAAGTLFLRRRRA